MIPKNRFLKPVAVLNGPIRLLDRKRNRVLAFSAALCGGWDAPAPLRRPEYSLCPVCVCDLSFHWHKKARGLHLPRGSSDAGDSDSAESVGTHRLGAKNNRNGFPPSSGGQRPEAGGWDRMPAWSGSGRTTSWLLIVSSQERAPALPCHFLQGQ